MFEKKMVWPVIIWFSEVDSEGEPVGFSSPSDTLYANSYEAAIKLRKDLLSDKHYYYRKEWIESVDLDEPQEQEILIS